MKTIKRILKFGPTIEVYAIFLTLALVLTVIPLLILTRYAIPYFDDYGYSTPVWVYYMLGGYNPKGVIVGAVKNAIGMRYAWQGTYGSIFLMGLNPMVFGEQYYFLGPLFLIVNFIVSLFTIIGVTAKRVFRAKGLLILGLQSGITLLLVMLLYSPQQGFYWFNGGIHYLGIMSFEFYYIALLIALLLPGNNKKSNQIWTVVGALASLPLAFLVAGGNFVNALQTPILVAVGVVLALIKKNKRVLLWLPSITVYALGFYLNVSAPGNSIRAALYPGTPGAIQSILLSFPTSWDFFKEFSDKRTVIHLLFLLPLAWTLFKQTENKKYPLSGIPVLGILSYCIYAASFTPGLYGTGRIDLARMINVNRITYHLMLIAILFYSVGAVRAFILSEHKQNWLDALSKKIRAEGDMRVYWLPLVILIAAWIAVFVKSPDRSGQFTVFGATYYLTSKEAVRFHNDYLQRVVLLKTDISDVEFKPYSVRPWYLIWTDISEDPTAEANEAMAKYYGKNSVRISSE